MALRFSIEIGSLGEENLILLTRLKEFLQAKRGRISEIFIKVEEQKGKSIGLTHGSECRQSVWAS